MTCQEYLDRLLAGLADDGAAQDEEAAHESSCPKCRERATSLRAALTGLAAAPALTPPGFAKAAMAKVARAQAPWEKPAPSLLERISTWFTPKLVPALAGALGCALLAVAVTRNGSHGPGGAQLARTVKLTERGFERVSMGEVADATFTAPAEAKLYGNARVELALGTVSLSVHHAQVGPEGFTVVTPHLTARVTGTEFTVRTGGGQTTVELYSGRIEVTPAAAGAAPIVMKPGERLSGTDAGLVPLVKKDPTWAQLPSVPAGEVSTRPLQPVAEPEPPVASRPAASVPAPTSPVPSGSEPVGGTALPDVSSNANVHEPFRVRGQ